jgi:polyhydroxybutyrate depolymerase
MRSFVATGLLLAGCTASRPSVPAATASAGRVNAAPSRVAFRLRLCTEAPIRLQSAPGAVQSRGCVATFRQTVSDPATARSLGATEVERRYLVYAPDHLPSRPSPVVFVFPGYASSAEAVAFYDTQTRFESLADRDGFVVVYGNGLPNPPSSGEGPSVPKGGFLQGCFAAHDGEGIDVAYVRRIVANVGAEIPLDRSRIYATGISAGGGLSFELALEAPDLVAAIAPVVPVPFQPSGPWLRECHARLGYERVSIAMVAATDDPFVAYAEGPSRVYPQKHFPGMEATRDSWLAALGLSGDPVIEPFPDVVRGDSYEPMTGRTSSTIERQRYGPGPDGRELWFYKATGMGHAWPNPAASWKGLWNLFGKRNQDIDFADEAWSFFERHTKGEGLTAAPSACSGGVLTPAPPLPARVTCARSPGRAPGAPIGAGANPKQDEGRACTMGYRPPPRENLLLAR